MIVLTRRGFLRFHFYAISVALFLGPLSTALFAQEAAPRPFEILVLGDSIMWGQGLLDQDKFSFKTAEWLRTDIFKGRRTVPDPHIEAHSGATIFPEFDPAKDFTKQNYFGESNLSNPAILFQIDNALEYYESASRLKTSLSREKVDLILVDGGINDFSAASLLSLKISDSDITAYARNFCGYGMKTVLRLLSVSFPNARIVVTGYYAPFSEKTDKHIISRTLLGAVGIQSSFINWPFHQDGQIVGRLAARSALWRDQSDIFLRQAVNTINAAFPFQTSVTGTVPANNRIIFVPAPFKPENSYGTGENDTFLWTLGKDLLPGDDRQNQRVEGCVKDVSGLHLKTCNRAAAFHPNKKGANAYFEAIRNALQPIFRVE